MGAPHPRAARRGEDRAGGSPGQGDQDPRGSACAGRSREPRAAGVPGRAARGAPPRRRAARRGARTGQARAGARRLAARRTIDSERACGQRRSVAAAPRRTCIIARPTAQSLDRCAADATRSIVTAPRAVQRNCSANQGTTRRSAEPQRRSWHHAPFSGPSTEYTCWPDTNVPRTRPASRTPMKGVFLPWLFKVSAVTVYSASGSTMHKSAGAPCDR